MPLPHADLLRLKRWNTPTIYNGWEQIAAARSAAGATTEELLARLADAGREFNAAGRREFRRGGEW